MIVYVSVVDPSWAVTTIVIVLEPTFKFIELDAEPELTVVPLTVTVALAWFTVGVTVTLVTPLATLSV